MVLLVNRFRTPQRIEGELKNNRIRTNLCFFQLLVGSEDYDIRVFKDDEIIAEMTETEVRKIPS